MLESKFQTERDRDFDAVECLRWAFCTEPCSGGGGWERRDIFNSSGRCQSGEDLPLISQVSFKAASLGSPSVPVPILRWRSWRRAEWCGVYRHNLLPWLTHRREWSCTEQVIEHPVHHTMQQSSIMIQSLLGKSTFMHRKSTGRIQTKNQQYFWELGLFF